MATVIYANFGDTDTVVLSELWDCMDNINVVEITAESLNSLEKVDEAIRNENDLVILCGHGSDDGLFSPDRTNLRYLIDCRNSYLIKTKRVVGIWCHASDFAKKNNLKGFFSGMFISNQGEARLCGISDSDPENITAKEIEFCRAIRSLIINGTHMSEWIEKLKINSDMEDDIVKYNYSRLQYYE